MTAWKLQEQYDGSRHPLSYDFEWCANSSASCEQRYDITNYCKTWTTRTGSASKHRQFSSRHFEHSLDRGIILQDIVDHTSHNLALLRCESCALWLVGCPIVPMTSCSP